MHFLRGARFAFLVADMSDIERRTRVSRRRITRNGRRVTDPATPPVGDDRGEGPPQDEVLRERGSDGAVDSGPRSINSSTIVASDKYPSTD
jgi:hypothetical protein